MELEARLDLKFKRREWLLEAMTHTSWINERGAEGRDNERLEYLGDAVLELVAAEYLFNRFPNYDEGQLTQMRSSLVSTVALAGIGEQLRLGEALRLGRGATKSGARRLTSLHANAFEAIIGATFLDQGYRKAGKIFLSRIGDLSSWTDPNFKGRLQALAQERFGMPPLYRTQPAGNTRPRQYLSQVSVEGGPVLGEGRGGTKQVAEQGAARAAIDGLVAPVSKKRRRASRSTAGAAESTGEPLTALSLQAVAVDISLAVAPAAGGGEPGLALGTVAPARKRRRRSRGSATGALPAHGPGEGTSAPADVIPTPALSAPALEEAALPSSVPPPARRRRRRSRAGSGGAAADSAVPEGQPAGTASDQGPPSASEPTGATSPDAAPPRRRRRRSRSGATTSEPATPAAAEPGTEAQATGTPEGPGGEPATTPNLDGPVDPAQRKRTHRGHRGGRRRSGRPATPTP
ncbi:MAG TPA: ribonuclease III [Candidatus Acidoferrales bacterium]|nr:ribonuclease III [Candidatus Acidoferrales bacterium]